MSRMLTPWDVRAPRVFDDLRQQMSQVFEQFFGPENGGEQRALMFAPRVNIAENEKQYEVTVDLPGMKPEEFDLELKEGQLWITGERKHETEQKGKTYHRIERQYGRFQRVLPLSSDVDPENVQAEYKDGVLHVRIPKTEAARPKKIEIKS